MPKKETFVNTTGLARALFMDARSLRSRLNTSGIEPDASFLESGGISSLFSVTRIPQIAKQVGAFVDPQGFIGGPPGLVKCG